LFIYYHLFYSQVYQPLPYSYYCPLPDLITDPLSQVPACPSCSNHFQNPRLPSSDFDCLTARLIWLLISDFQLLGHPHCFRLYYLAVATNLFPNLAAANHYLLLSSPIAYD